MLKPAEITALSAAQSGVNSFLPLCLLLSTHLTSMKNVQQFPLFDLLIVYTPQFPPLERKKEKIIIPGHIKSDKNNEESVILWKISGHVETCY